MLAQRKHLEKQLIENYNKTETIRKESETKAQKSARKKEDIRMFQDAEIDFMKSHIT